MESLLVQIAQVLNIPEVDCSLSFTRLGGHSLSAIRLVSACKQLGIRLTVGDVLQSVSITHLLTLATPIPPSSVQSASTPDTPRCLTPESVADSSKTPMSEMQLSLIRGSFAQSGNNILAYHFFCHPHEVPALKAAWKTVLEGEEVFRLGFCIENGEGHLVDMGYTPHRWMEITVADQEALQAELLTPPSFSDVRFEFRVVTIAEDEATACLLWHVHHALVDGYSMEVLVDKVSRVLAGDSVEPGPSFADVASERQRMIDRRQDDALAYWKSQQESLETASSEILMPQEPEDSSVFWNELATFQVHISSIELADYARRHQVTVPAVYYAAWALVLSVVCDSDRVLFGAVLSGRSLPIPGILETVGCLVNTLPIAITVNETMTTVQFIHQVFEQLVTLSAYDWTHPEHGYRRRFSSVLAMQFNTNQDGSAPTRMNSEMPLSLTIEAEGRIHIQSTKQFRKDQVNLLGTYLARTVEFLTRHSTVGMCLEHMLSLSDRQTLFTLGNCTSGLTTETSVHEDLTTLLRRTAQLDLCAVRKADQSMSYRELDQWSDQVARHLSSFVHHGDVVCVHAEPSLYWIVAVYGILKAGAVYCPLHAGLDANLRNTQFELSKASVFLTPSRSDKQWQPTSSQYCWAVEELLQASQTDEKTLLASPPSNAYLCFTSGSTGRPKGVLCTHQGLVAFQRDREVRLLAEPGRRIAQIMSLSFDGSIHEIFSALSYGATLVLPYPDDPFRHLHDVDTCILTPSLAATLDPDDYPNLAHIYLVGEQVPQEVNDRWGERTLYNMYGPTEATCGATIKRLHPGHRVTLGRPNPSTRIYILDRRRRLAPPGVKGQICLAGVQVSNGYLDQPELTAERFLPDSICRGLGERMYLTGDIGYWNADGELVCLGRDDRQIKLRGFRLDLDDLEVRIARLPGITAAAVARHPNGDELIVMVQPSSISIPVCRREMASVLPAHAIPRYILPVERFPTTTAGKLDYKAVANTTCCCPAFTPPRMNSTEQRVARVWSDILNLSQGTEITSESNFIALGGHSLLQLRLASSLSAVFKCTVPLTAVIEARTLHDLSERIDQLQSSPNPQSVRPRPEGISRMEAEWVAKYARDRNTSAFNVSFACRLTLDSSRLVQSWNTVLARHPILRSRYRPGSSNRVYADHPPRAQWVDECHVAEEINRPFDLERDDLIRVTVTDDFMLITVGHIICDLTTMQLLLREVAQVYQGYSVDKPSPSYAGAAAWTRIASHDDLAFWTQYLEDAPTPGTKRTSYAGLSRVSMIPDEIAKGMDELISTSTSSLTHHQVALAAVSLALHALNTDPRSDIDIILGAPFLNRWSEADMNTTGLFLEPIPIRIQSASSRRSNTALSFLQCVQCSSQMALSHAIPWHDLLQNLDITPDFPSHPLFETMVTFHDRDSALTFPLDGVEPLYTWSEGAKFGLMCEFTALQNGLILRLEYDTESWEEIQVVETLIVRALGLLIKGISFDQIVETLQELKESGQDSMSPKEMFLMPLDCI